MPIDKKTFDDKFSEDFTSLFGRMDTDKDLYYLADYIMVDQQGKPVPDVENMTLNDPFLYANKVVGALGGAAMQTVVESKSLKDQQMSRIEEFLKDLVAMVDLRLLNREIPGLLAWANFHIAVRGRIAARVYLRMEKNEFIPDILPVDARYIAYERGAKGFLWFGYKTPRSKAAIKDEYGLDLGESKGKEDVVDLWDSERNITYVGDEKVRDLKNPFGYPPFVLSMSTSGSLLQDADAMEHSGESIFGANRKLYRHLNLAATILQTLNVMSFRGPMQYESEAGTAAEKPVQPPYGVGAVIPVEKAAGYKAMPIQDIRQATRVLYAILDSRLQRGSLPTIDYGTLTFPLSAVAITQLTASKNEVFVPLLQGISLFLQGISNMAIKQYQDAKLNVALGERGLTNKYGWKDLAGDYQIRYKFSAKIPEQDVANYAIADAASNYLGREKVLRDIIRVDNPASDLGAWYYDQAERDDVAVRMYRRASKFIEMGKDVEARMVANSLRLLLRKRRMGEGAPEEPTPEKIGALAGGNGQGLVPLLGQGGGGTKGRPELGGLSAEAQQMDAEKENVP